MTDQWPLSLERVPELGLQQRLSWRVWVMTWSWWRGGAIALLMLLRVLLMLLIGWCVPNFSRWMLQKQERRG
jgi:hypothetical protein